MSLTPGDVDAALADQVTLALLRALASGSGSCSGSGSGSRPANDNGPHR
jgi:hypothetical protein